MTWGRARWGAPFAALAVAVGLLAGSAGGQGPGDTVDPPTYGQVAVLLDGDQVGTFAQVVSITSEVVAPEFAPVPGKETIKKSTATSAKTPQVVLERGLSANLALWAWHAQARQAGAPGAAPRTATLVVFGDDGAPLARFAMTNAWPSKLEVRTASDGGRSNLLIERATFVMDALERLQP